MRFGKKKTTIKRLIEGFMWALLQQSVEDGKSFPEDSDINMEFDGSMFIASWFTGRVMENEFEKVPEVRTLKRSSHTMYEKVHLSSEYMDARRLKTVFDETRSSMNFTKISRSHVRRK